MSNITVETSSFSEQLGVFDFFNVLVSGITFIGGLCIVNLNLTNFLLKDMNVINGVGIIILSYILGLIIQEIASIWDKYYGKLYRGMNRGILKGQILNKHTKVKENEIVENPWLLKQYRVYAAELIEKIKREEDDAIDYNNEYISAFLFSVCQYYVAVDGKDRKVEKMRALYEMSKMLMTMFALLTGYTFFLIELIISGISVEVPVDVISLIGIEVNVKCSCISIVVFCLFYAGMTILFYYRSRKVMKRFLLVLLGTYDAIKRKEEWSEKQNVNLM